MTERFLFSSESVTEGHPDKVADQISDGVLDAILMADPKGRVACETLCTTGMVMVAGEITTETYVDIPKIAREIVKDIGYTRAKYGFDGDTCAVLTAIDEQSSNIKDGVDKALEDRTEQGSHEESDNLGAGDQGMMTGFACNETDEYLPAPIALAHQLARKLTEVRKNGLIPYLRPDGKTQVTLEYADGKPTKVHTVVVSAQHHPEATNDEIRRDIIEHVINPVINRAIDSNINPANPKKLSTDGTKILVNPSGKFEKGGPLADCGLTGRKIIVDTYGGWVPHGGGAFSGKDPTKVDRSGAYMARYVAKNVVAAGLADQCYIQVAYAIGVAEPVSVMVDTRGTAKGITDEKITALVRELFDFRPSAIIRDLGLRKPQYQRLAAYGHMGRIDLDPKPAWEETDRADALRAAAKN